MKTFKSDISQKKFPLAEKIEAHAIHKSLLTFIQLEHPHFNDGSMLAHTELKTYREKFITQFLLSEMGTLTAREQTVVDSMMGKNILADKLDEDEHQVLTFGQQVADKVATFGGSWTFIISFMTFLIIWIVINAALLANRGFDPYPFILLNLLLSCLAALQAPVIMMSQNRQEEKDRERAKKDYKINLKSELEIRELHEKIDHLIIHYQQDLLEIQKTQIDLLENILLNLS